MRKAILLTGLVLLAETATARAQDAAPTAGPAAQAAAEAPPAPERQPRKLELALTVVPMGFGRFTSAPGGVKTTEDGAFSYGLNVSSGYQVLPGLTIGLAPQLLFNVKPKSDAGRGYKELDALLRVAYTVTLVDTIAVYAEVLPGYSFILPPDGSSAPKGLVVAFGAGGMLELGQRAFALVGGGYQLGFQNVTFDGVNAETRTRFVRFTIGGGVRF